MNFSERVRGVLRTPGTPGTGGIPGTPGTFGTAGTAGAPDPCSTLEGEWQTAGSGARWLLVERRYEAATKHGHTRVGEMAEQLNRAAERLRHLDARSCSPFLFFDLETTGLNGGAGTYAFLVGCAGLAADGGLVTRQYLLTRFADERAMLVAVAEELAGAGALVSFNGKSFDAPVLETRYLYHRLAWCGADLPHVDLLHPSRRFWADEGGCSLAFLEEAVLGAGRQSDVSGFEIPARYFQFVRSGDARPLGPVLEHNRLDLLSLAALTSRMCRLLDEGVTAVATPLEALALGRIYAAVGDEGRAWVALTHAADTARDPTVLAESRRALALLARRTRRHDEAARHWRLVLECPGCPARLVREATEALAIHHEHRVRDLELARTFALRSLREAGSRPASSWAAAVRHRVSRIERKMRTREMAGQSARLELGD